LYALGFVKEELRFLWLHLGWDRGNEIVLKELPFVLLRLWVEGRVDIEGRLPVFYFAPKKDSLNPLIEARAHLKELLNLKEGPTADAYDLLANLEMEEHKDWKAAIKWLKTGLQAPRHA